MSDLESFLGGAPALKFPKIGTEHTLKISEEPVVKQTTDYDTGELETWPDGSPKKQMIITGVIPEADREDDDDDGERRLFIKSGLTAALRAGLRAAKAKIPEVGGTIVVAYVEDGPQESKKKQPPKIYEIDYTPPRRKAKAAAEFIGTDDDEDDEPAPRRRRRAPAEDEDETPAPRRGRIQREVDEAKSNVRRRKAAAAQDEDDDEPPF